MTDFLHSQQLSSIDHLNNMKLIAQQQITENEHSIDLHRINERLKAEKEISSDLAEDVMFYKSLLSRPMAEIAKYNVDFAAAFKMQQQIMSDWILSQKAYKELALDLAFEMGIPSDEIDKAYVERANQIADDTHPNSKMPEEFKPYANNSAEYITSGVIKKLKKNGSL